MNTFDKIYSIVSQIPKGKVMTYGQVGKIAGVNPRVVGFAMRANKDTKNVPCHRVVSSDGTLRGYAFGGISQKKILLEEEGATFLEDGKVDFIKSLFDYP